MIVVKNKADCCGCTACYSVCPKKTISMQQDQEGFLYPFVEISKCIDCKLCDSACPIENKIDSKMFDRKAYVLRAKDVEIVSTSTSGGFVTPLGDCFSEIKKHLMQETKVCFIGTPCQVYGLKSYLRKEYDNLVTVDLVCHGTPSPKLWKKYLDEQKDKYHSEIDDIVFRNKTYGYHSGTMRIRFKNQFVYYGSARVDPMLRDENTKNIVGKLVAKQVEIVCDPTMLLPINELDFPHERKIKDRYMIVYSYSVPKEHQVYLKRYAKDFYVNKLGFAVIRENYRPERKDWKLDLRVNEYTELEIFAEENPPKRVNRPEACGLRHLAFCVDSVEQTVKELAEVGIECEPIRVDDYTGKKMTFFHDPDGLPLELHE